MARFGLPLDEEHPLLFQVVYSDGVQIMEPEDIGDWVWTQLEDHDDAFQDVHARVFQYKDTDLRPEGRKLLFRVTAKGDGTKDVLLHTSSGALEYNEKPYVINVGYPTPRTCFYIDTAEFDEGKGYVPCVAKERQLGREGVMRGSGAFAVPWYWGMTPEAAQKACDEANTRKELTPEDVKAIMTSAGLTEFLV